MPLDITYFISHLQSYWEITSDDYLAYISKYVVGLGPWKDTTVPASGNYLMPPSDLVARAHAYNLQVWHLFVFIVIISIVCIHCNYLKFILYMDYCKVTYTNWTTFPMLTAIFNVFSV